MLCWCHHPNAKNRLSEADNKLMSFPVNSVVDLFPEIKVNYE